MTLRALILVGAVLASSAAAAEPDEIPVPMRGTWARDASACGSDESRVVIAAHRAEFAPRTNGIGRRSYSLYVDTTDADGTVHASGLRNDEGMAGMFADAMTLKLVAEGRLQIDALGREYVRCAD